MTPEILQGVRALAEFEGYVCEAENPLSEKAVYRKGGDFFILEFSTYHSSLDALWPVWELFRDLRWEKGMKDDYLDWADRHTEFRDRIETAVMYGSVEKAFTLLVEAVEWYQKKKGGSHAV